MCQSTNHRHSVFCILPPHILQAIANHGTPQQRAMALQTLGTDHTVRSLRAMTLQAIPAARRHPRISAVTEAQKHRTIYDAHHTETLPGTVVRTEGAQSSNGPAVDEAYDGLGATFDFYWDQGFRSLSQHESIRGC